MSFELDAADAEARARARACAESVVAPAAAAIDREGRIPLPVGQAAQAVVSAAGIRGDVTFVAAVEELAAASAAVALAAAAHALGAPAPSEVAQQWPGLRGADVDGVRKRMAHDARWHLAVTAVLVGVGRAALAEATAALRVALVSGALRGAAHAPLADAATALDAARLLLWDASGAGRDGPAAASARGMARLQAVDATGTALAAAECATEVDASRPGATLERLSRDRATMARVFGELPAAAEAVASEVLPG